LIRIAQKMCHPNQVFNQSFYNGPFNILWYKIKIKRNFKPSDFLRNSFLCKNRNKILPLINDYSFILSHKWLLLEPNETKEIWSTMKRFSFSPNETKMFFPMSFCSFFQEKNIFHLNFFCSFQSQRTCK